MFNDRYGLTDAVLERRKTVTRRVIPKSMLVNIGYPIDIPKLIEKSYYKIGEILAVSERYCDIDESRLKCKKDELYSLFKEKGWKNKMFVKANLMPNHIMITNIRVERLQDISNEDCIKEGVELNKRQFDYDGTYSYSVCGLKHWRSIGCYSYSSPKEAFSVLIDKISGKGTWENNPYVFVYDFKICD